MAKKMTDEQFADQMIKEMEEAGLTPDQMLEVLKNAREKFEHMKASETPKPPTELRVIRDKLETHHSAIDWIVQIMIDSGNFTEVNELEKIKEHL